MADEQCRAGQSKAPFELTSGEQALIGATRIWAEAWRSGGGDYAQVERFFARFDVAAATPSHHRLLYNSHVAASRTLAINAPRSAGLTLDESRLSSAVGCMQAGCSGVAERIVADWLPPAARSLTVPALQALATAFARQGLWAPVRPWSVDAGRRADFDRTRIHAPGGSLIH